MNSPDEVQLIESLADPSLRQSRRPRDDNWRARGWFKQSRLYL